MRVTVSDPVDEAAAEDRFCSAEHSRINKWSVSSWKKKNISICCSLDKEGQVVTAFWFMVQSHVLIILLYTDGATATATETGGLGT